MRTHPSSFRRACQCLLLFSVLLLISPARGEDAVDYDTGMAQATAFIRQGDLRGAEGVVSALLKRYPDNRELLTILARLLFWQERYDEALSLYDGLIRTSADEELRKERTKVANAKALDEADGQIARGDTESAERILRGVYDSGSEHYESGRRLGMLYMRQRQYVKASAVFTELAARYPHDAEMRALLIDALIMRGQRSKARAEYRALSEEMRAGLSAEREDLLYRLNRNYAKLSGSFHHYTDGFGEEKWLSLELSQRIGDLTFVLTPAHARRYGLSDSQVSLEVHAPLGGDTKRWGYLALSVSPDHEFLPETVLGGEVYQGFEGFELSLGYRRMNFRDSAVDIVAPGLFVYLPRGCSLAEKLYVTSEDWTFTLASTLYYEPDHRTKCFLSIVIGNASETITSRQDVQKFATFGGTLGGEHRWSPSWSAGIELSGEYRRDLYRKFGVLLFSRFWW